MNKLQKIVFSKTLEKTDWENTSLIKENVEETIIKLKNLPGKDIVILASGKIVSLLTGMNLIDEYRVIINPVILWQAKCNLQLVSKKKRLSLAMLKDLDREKLCYIFSQLNQSIIKNSLLLK